LYLCVYCGHAIGFVKRIAVTPYQDTAAASDSFWKRHRRQCSTLAVIIILFLTGCGRKSFIEPEFLPHVESFQANYACEWPSRLEIVFTDFTDEEKDRNKWGSCQKDVGGRVIWIDREAWGMIHPNHQEYLLYHEMGHCILDREHGSSRIMSKGAMDHNTFKEYKDEHVRELMGECYKG